MPKPTCEQIINEELGEPIQTKNDPWRHGVTTTEVYHRKEDDTFWQVLYCVSSDGETNDLREGYATIMQVWPYEVMVTKYKTIPPAEV